jgi:hypothetical protein
MVNSGDRWLKCPRCHPESLAALSRPSTTDIRVAAMHRKEDS